MESAAVSFNSFGQRGEQACRYRQKKNLMQSSTPNPDSEPPDRKMDAISNLHRFLQHTTPRVPSQFLSKTHLRGLCPQGSEGREKNFFSLNDLWDSFDEWSAYGAGVPILLNGKETVMQYYVPYLSAIQLYSSSASELTSKNRRHLGDDSDGSEMDYRDSNSETSSSDGELERVSDQASWNSLDVQRIHEGESLLFEYFESAAPSLRVPLFDKVSDLARQFPGMKIFCSNDLSQSSWLSVAWYPIYRIPTGPTLKDLAACFLTYHSLSTLLTDDSNDIAGAHSLLCGTKVALHPFGLAGYKFRGPVWTLAGGIDHHRATLLHRSSDDWLKRLCVRHPDFEYFMSHCPSTHR